MMPPRERRSSAAKERLSRDRHRQHQPFGLAVLGDQRHADALRLWRRAGCNDARPCRRSGFRRRRRSARRTAPAAIRAGPGRRGRRGRRSRRPRTASEMLCRRCVQARSRNRGRAARRSAPARASAGRRGCIRGRSSSRRPRRRCSSPAAIGGDVAAVAKHRAFVGEFGDLVHAV